MKLLAEAVNETREQTAKISGQLEQLVNAAGGRRAGEPLVCSFGKLHEKAAAAEAADPGSGD